MKRITTILMLLMLVCMGAGATFTMPTLTTDPAKPALYSIQSYRAYTFVQYAGDNTAMTPTFDFTSDNAKFYFVSVNGTDYSGGVKIVSYASGKQINEMSGFAETGTTWYLGESTYASGCFNIGKQSNFKDCWDCNGSGNMTANYWNPNTEGSTWQIVSVDDLPQYQVSTLESPKWYYLKTGRGNYVYANGSSAGLTGTNPKTEAYKFAFISTENYGVNIVSKAGVEASSNQYLTTTSGLSSEASTWYFFNAARYPGYFVLSDANNTIAYAHLLNDNGQGGLAKWYVDGTGSYFQVEEVLPVCDVTYNIVLAASGTVKATSTQTENIGGPFAVPASIKRDYCTYRYYSDAACTAEITEVPDASTTTVYALASYTMPFTVSANYAGATWYYMNLKPGETHVPTYDSESTPNVTLSTSSRVLGNTNQQWCFVGNPYDGFQIYNNAATDAVKLGTDTDPSSDGNTGGSTQVALSASPTYGTWYVQESAYGTNGFYMFLKVGDNKYGANLRGTKFAFWTTSYGDGSTFTIEEVTDNYKDYVVANIKPWIDTFGQYFSLASNSENTDWVNNTYYPALTSCTLSEYNELLAYVADASHWHYPASGYYRLRNYRYDTSYMGLESNLAQFADGGSKAATVVYLTKHESNNTYTIQLQGKYVQTPTSGAQVTMGDDAVWFTPTADAPGIFSLNAGGGNRGNLHNDGYQKIVGWEATGRANNNASYWYIENASSFNVSLNSDGAGTYYATGYWPFDVTISGADAYTLKLDGTGNWLVPTLLTGNKVPANTPVMLKGSSNTATASIRTVGDAFTTSNVNSLSGTNTAKDFALTDDATAEYFMGINGGVVGFYHSGVASKTVSETKYYTLKANRAYLVESALARGYEIMWDDSETTGVNEVIGKMSEVTDGAIYDLQGRKVANPSRGLYIINGHKVVIK